MTTAPGTHMAIELNTYGTADSGKCSSETHAGGRGIRFSVSSPGEIPAIKTLVEIKTLKELKGGRFNPFNLSTCQRFNSSPRQPTFAARA
jgi:hypothetical protein